ncbi:helix-turn-helix domain-containing protein [Micromonospora sp. MA102]|uniref:helix-turn-helix domain-containing protein n=1 Tax=Micromonospora sp. MA102 TaxID=2952755 RepID=UPI0034D96B5B
MSATSGSGYVGWVLRSNRRFAGNADFHLARNFARVFRLSAEAGLAPSQITRWEQGTTTASRGVLRRYEQLLGVPPESFVVVSDAMRRSEGLTLDVTPGRQDDQSRLYELLDRALSPGEMTGADWGVLSGSSRRSAPGGSSPDAACRCR